jgi:hypothetical protein
LAEPPWDRYVRKTQELSYPAKPLLRRAPAVRQSASAKYVASVLVLAAAYYSCAKIGQTLRYTGSVSAIWPPAGLGIAALYLWGLRWWPGVFSLSSRSTESCSSSFRSEP